MEILKLTDSDSVRTALGVTDKDVSEEYFDQSDLETELELQLHSWLPDYTSIVATAVSGSPTTDEERAFSHLCMYAKYFCADVVSKSTNFMVAQMESDGENEYQRYQDNKLEKLIDSIHRKISKHRAFLADYAASTFSADEEVTTYSQFGKASPSSDPVTGEST